jgi:hypothetical protein
VSEQQDEETNLWHGPQVSPPSGPVPPRGADHDQTSASERAFAEGWPAQPGWVPEGGVGTAWGAAQPQQYEPQQPEQHQPQPYEQSYAPQANQTWVPQQPPYAAQPYPGAPEAYPGGGYPPAGGQPYPGPNAPLPRSGSNTTVVVSVVVAVLLVAAVVGGVVFFQRGSGHNAPAVPAANGTTSTGATANGQPRSTGGSSTTGSSTSGSSKSGGSTSGTGSTTAPMTSSTSIDLTTVHVPAYAAGPDANDVAHTLDAYFTGINSANYQTAYEQLSSSMQAKNPYSQFEDNTAGTIDSDVTVTGVNVSGDGSARTSVTFTSTQPADKGVVSGQTCTNWSITYLLQPGGGAGGWLISGTPTAQHSGC